MSDLANTVSLSSFALNLIASEIGFIGVQPTHDKDIYNDFISFFNGLRNKIANNDLVDENCGFCFMGKNHHFDVDFYLDAELTQDIIKMMAAILKMSGETDSFTVKMCVELIYTKIGMAINSHDSYFNILKSLWLTMIENKADYGANFDTINSNKIRRAEELFHLTDDRINALKSL